MVVLAPPLLWLLNRVIQIQVVAEAVVVALQRLLLGQVALGLSF
jgi:hypothetical protein